LWNAEESKFHGADSADIEKPHASKHSRFGPQYIGNVNDIIGNSSDKLRHPRSAAYSVELVLLNKHQISGGGAYLN